jgi:UDP-N-acetylmuramoyl-L-alanyl-D-glutamate--2,6-diaminopimelate ligase
MRLPDLITASRQFQVDPDRIPDVDIHAIQFDSRKVEPGGLFVALTGGSFDGHSFINNAIQKGAAAVVGSKADLQLKVPYFQTNDTRLALAHLAAAFQNFPARQLTVIGVTGTDGKTTTVNLIFRILLACGIRAGMISTVSAVIGDEQIDTGLHVTTPEAPDTQALLRRMVAGGFTHVVLEATSHGLDQQRVAACDFDIGVVTNITHEHLDYHGDYNGYLNAKMKLLTGLAETPEKVGGNYRTAIYNKDDISFPHISRILAAPEYKSIRQKVYGLDETCDLSARDVQVSAQGLIFKVMLKGQPWQVVSPLVGEYNVHNILAAIGGTALGLGLDMHKVLQGVRAMQSVPGRMESIDLGQDFTAIVDFAHTPNALKVALQTANKIKGGGRVIAVFGSAGLRDREKRRMMAATSVGLADVTILTAEDPRTESLDDILAEMADEARRSGGVEGQTFFRVPDRGEAIRKAVTLARKGDIVITCGKGHEQSMCFGETEYPWDDRTAMRAALAERLGIPGPVMPYLPTQDKK